MTRKLLVPTVVAAAAILPAAIALSDPPNDARDEAERIGDLPELVTGTTADAHHGKDDADTCADTSGSVWYRIDPGRSRRVVAKLAAQGDLDAVLDVYRRERSQHSLLTCDPTDRNGRAAVAFDARKGESYLIRVAKRAGSAAGGFDLRVAGAEGPRLPGPPLPPGGISGSLDRVQRTAQAWSTTFRQGRRYRIRLTHPGSTCIRASVYRAGTRPTPTTPPLARTDCRGYGLFTSRPGQGERFSVFVNAVEGIRGNQRYHLQAAPAGRDDSAPGRPAPNYARLDGTIGTGVDAIDLFRFDVTRRSVLFLGLRTPAKRARIDVLLLNEAGDVIRCNCDGRGSALLRKGLRPGRYFIAARARGAATAPYTLLRASRTITETRVRMNGAGSATIVPGQPATVSALIEPAATGPVIFTLEHFDPLSGWQYVRRLNATAAGGRASATFTPDREGRWRATARYVGTRGNAPSDAGDFVELTVANPLVAE